MPKRSAPKLLALPGLEEAMAPSNRPVSPAAKALTLRAGKGKSRARCAVAPAPRPWCCAILAVDTAKHSGWSIWCDGELEEHGEVDTLDAPKLLAIVARAVDGYACAGGIPLVLVLERAWGPSVHTREGLAVAKERWKRAWRDAAQAETRVVTVQPSTWRSAVLGRAAVELVRGEVRALEQRVAAGIAGKPVGQDEAPAILIGRWASHAGRVGEAIGKRASKASLKAWQRGGA